MDEDVITLDLKQLLQIFLRRWWIIAVAVIICLSVAFSLVFYFLDPVYKADTTLYIGKNVDQQSELTYNDMMLGTQLVKDYRELVISRMVSNTVIEELGLEDITAGQLSDKLTITSKNDTRVIQISTEDKDPELAMNITNKVADIFQTKVVEIMQVENVQVIDRAELPENPVKPNKLVYFAVAGLLGIALGVFIIFLIEYLDDTIKTPEDVAKHIDLPVIGTIPVFPKQ